MFSNFSAYLGRSTEDPEPIDLVPENSHRWRALPAWFSLTAYGAEGHREIVERDRALARELSERIQRSELFDLLVLVRLNIVCFALRRRDLTEKLVAAVQDTGQTFVTPTVLHGRAAIRAAFSSWRTTERDLDIDLGGAVAAAERLCQAEPRPC